MRNLLIFITLFMLMVSTAAAQDDVNFSVSMPEGWATTSANGIVGAADPNTGAVFYAYSAANPEQALALANELLAQPSTLTQAPVEVSRVELPGGAWEQRVFISADMITLSLVQDTGSIVFVLIAHAPLHAAEDLLPAFQSTLNSFVVSGAVVVESAPTAVIYPVPGGDFAVGRTEAVWTDESREELFSPEPDDKRQIPVTIWYPAEISSSARRAAWLLPEMSRAFAQIVGTTEDTLAQIAVNAYQDAPLAESAIPFPVVILSHGDRTIPALYTSYAESLASSGFVVVGIAHPYNALLVTLQDGTAITALPEAGAAPMHLSPEMSPLQIAEAIDEQGRTAVAVGAADVRFVIDYLEDGQNLNNLFQGRIDLSRIGVMGHSLGGAVAIEALIQDARVDAAINLDGTVFSEVSTPIDRPVLIVGAASSGQAGALTPEMLPPGMTSEEFAQIVALTTRAQTLNQQWPHVYFVTIDGAAHNNFMDAGLLAPMLPMMNSELGAIDAAYALEISAHYAAAFFQGALMDAAWNPSELASRYPESTLLHP